MNTSLCGMSCVHMHQTENSNPILSCQGKKLTRNTPRRPGTKYIIPTHAILFGTRDTIVTPVKTHHNFYHTTNAAEKCGLQRDETERQNQKLKLIGQRVRDVI